MIWPGEVQSSGENGHKEIPGRNNFPRIVEGFKAVLRTSLGIRKQPFARELIEETIFIDRNLNGQLIIPIYANDRAIKETVHH